MALLDSTVVNVALPRIGEDLDADLAALQWTVNAYMLTLAGLILLGGALGDRYGRRKIFVARRGVVRRRLAAVRPRAERRSSWSPPAPCRASAAALLTPGSLALIQASFHPDDRARAVGLWSGFGGVGAAVGPFLGGWLVDGPGWRWVFLLNVPLAALCVPVALRHVPESRDPQAPRPVRRAGRGARRGGAGAGDVRADRGRTVLGGRRGRGASGWRSCSSSGGGPIRCCRRRSSRPGSSPRSTWSRCACTRPSAASSSWPPSSSRWWPATRRSAPVRRCCRRPC